MSNYYWAKFVEIDSNRFRLDTRIYLKSINKPSDDDICIGAVCGKNPGSACPKEDITGDLQIIDLDGDNLLPTVRSIFLKSYKEMKKPVKVNSYIQVLNLMYICDKNLSNAIKKISDYDKPKICETEKKLFPFLWYVWGNDDIKLNKFKERFAQIKADKQFYFHTKNEEIVERFPNLNNPARHTQGLSHDLVVPFISRIL